MAEVMTAQFGLRQEWTHFAESHRLFLERYPNLQLELETAFIRTGTTSEPVDRLVFFGGRLCAEDFMEILLLCGNGYGLGAMKILRGMYERVVPGRYLHAHSEETEAFFDFYWVSLYKLSRAIREKFGEAAVPMDKFEETQTNYHKVGERFMVSDCKECGTKRPNYTWSKLDFVSMAYATGPTGDRIVDAYYIPTQYAHSTVAAILARLREGTGGGVTFDAGPQRSMADVALISAHNLMLNVLDLQKEHFKLDALEKPLEQCCRDFQDIWKRKGEDQKENV